MGGREEPGSNDDAFARIDIDPYPQVGAEPKRVEARITIKPIPLAKTEHLMVVILGSSPQLIVVSEDPRAAEGEPLPVHQDNRFSDEPKFFLERDALQQADGIIIVPITFQTRANGLFHSGLYVAGFDEGWNAVAVTPEESAEAFGSSTVSGVGHERAALGPPFRGDGNDIPAPGVIVAGLALFLAGGRWSRNLKHRDGPD